MVDVYLSAAGDQPAAKVFLHSAAEVIGITITTEKRSGYPPALAKVFGDDVMHGMSKRKSSHLEQGHRGIKGRIRSVA